MNCFFVFLPVRQLNTRHTVRHSFLLGTHLTPPLTPLRVVDYFEVCTIMCTLSTLKYRQHNLQPFNGQNHERGQK